MGAQHVFAEGGDRAGRNTAVRARSRMCSVRSDAHARRAGRRRRRMRGFRMCNECMHCGEAHAAYWANLILRRRDGRLLRRRHARSCGALKKIGSARAWRRARDRRRPIPRRFCSAQCRIRRSVRSSDGRSCTAGSSSRRCGSCAQYIAKRCSARIVSRTAVMGIGISMRKAELSMASRTYGRVARSQLFGAAWRSASAAAPRSETGAASSGCTSTGSSMRVEYRLRSCLAACTCDTKVSRTKWAGENSHTCLVQISA